MSDDPATSPGPETQARRRIIVVGYDGSDAAKAALREGARRAGAGGRLVVVHSYALPPDFVGWPDYDHLMANRQAHAHAVLEAVLPEEFGELDGVEYEVELMGGPAAEAIAEVARVRDADEIVVGARGHGRLRGALGSVSTEVIHRADRPVTVIPAAAVPDG